MPSNDGHDFRKLILDRSAKIKRVNDAKIAGALWAFDPYSMINIAREAQILLYKHSILFIARSALKQKSEGGR